MLTNVMLTDLTVSIREWDCVYGQFLRHSDAIVYADEALPGWNPSVGARARLARGESVLVIASDAAYRVSLN